jgi:peroxiredoxin
MTPRTPAARPWLVAAVLAVLLAGGWFGWQALTRPEPAPPVAYTLLDGSKHHSDALRGKVVLVNFWATSCATCVAEMPELIATHNKFAPRGYETLAVAMSYDPPAYVARFAQTRALPFGVAIDNTGAIAKAYGDVKLTPTTFVLNKRGEIVKRYVGAPDFPALHALVEKLLAEPA